MAIDRKYIHGDLLSTRHFLLVMDHISVPGYHHVLTCTAPTFSNYGLSWQQDNVRMHGKRERMKSYVGDEILRENLMETKPSSMSLPDISLACRNEDEIAKSTLRHPRIGVWSRHGKQVTA